MVLMFHQLLGFLAIICCTGELCKTPLFMPFLISTISIYKREKKVCFLFFDVVPTQA